MMDAVVRKWCKLSSAPLSLETIRTLHQPSARFRISTYTYPPGTAFVGSGRAGTRYLLAGACSFTFGNSAIELRAEDVADVPDGDYQFAVVGDVPVQFVAVWALPQDLRTLSDSSHAAAPDARENPSGDGWA